MGGENLVERRCHQVEHMVDLDMLPSLEKRTRYLTA